MENDHVHVEEKFIRCMNSIEGQNEFTEKVLRKFVENNTYSVYALFVGPGQEHIYKGVVKSDLMPQIDLKNIMRPLGFRITKYIEGEACHVTVDLVTPKVMKVKSVNDELVIKSTTFKGCVTTIHSIFDMEEIKIFEKLIRNYEKSLEEFKARIKFLKRKK